MTLKDCLYKTIHKNKKPLKVIAEEVDMAVSYLTRSALPDSDESGTGTGCNFPLKKLIPITRSTSDFSVLDFIEQSLGRVAFFLPDPKQAGVRDVCRLTMKSVKEFGHLMSELEKGVADNMITAQEKERIAKEGYEAIQAIVSLLKFIKIGAL